MAQRKTLTEQQVSLLRWIAKDCPDGVVDGVSYRISAAALGRTERPLRRLGAAWLVRWVTETPGATIGRAAEVACSLADAHDEPLALESIRKNPHLACSSTATMRGHDTVRPGNPKESLPTGVARVWRND
jgi:hypothetical protein